MKFYTPEEWTMMHQTKYESDSRLFDVIKVANNSVHKQSKKIIALGQEIYVDDNPEAILRKIVQNYML